MADIDGLRRYVCHDHKKIKIPKKEKIRSLVNDFVRLRENIICIKTIKLDQRN